MLGSVSPYAAKSRLHVACRWLCTVQRRPAGGREGTTLQPALCWWVQGGADGLLKFSCDCPVYAIVAIEMNWGIGYNGEQTSVIPKTDRNDIRGRHYRRQKDTRGYSYPSTGQKKYRSQKIIKALRSMVSL